LKPTKLINVSVSVVRTLEAYTIVDY